MAKPASAPRGADNNNNNKKYEIPTVSFRIVTGDPLLSGPAGVHSEQARSYGYNDFSDFERPEHYIRYIEPIESELAVQVEYDMDEQDQEWLDTVNAERKKDQSGPISYEVFEIIMDKLEKEWFNLIKRIPQPPSNLPVEDSKCAICDDGEGENSNAIVFCDGCNLAVHQDCYGVPYIPEGQWLCRKCTVSPENPVSCLFCPNEGGAFKQTTTGHWAHLLCAIWIPELGVGNAIYMEPVEGVENVPKNRWKLVCSLCKERVGACIQCENKNCFTAFHVTCARRAGLLMSMKLMGADGALKAYCHKHLPAEWQDVPMDDDEDDDDYHDSDSDDDGEMATPMPQKRQRKNSTAPSGAAAAAPLAITTKTARAHAKSYRPGPPIVPRMIVNRLLDYVAKISIRKRQPFIERLCRYWSLKREARRGAPLLKRLHLEPWTATGETRELTEAEKAQKVEFLVALRNDLEKVRLLAELVRKREKEKLRQAQIIRDIVDKFIFPHYNKLRSALEKIVAMDHRDLFLNPVTKEEAPDYFEVIKKPMSWSTMGEKLEDVAYHNVADFKNDVLLVLDNAMLYNKSETPFHRSAARMKKNIQPILDELDSIYGQDAASFSHTTPSDIAGDLEVSLPRLEALIATDPKDPERDMLASLFVSEIEKPRSPTPPPPPPPEKRIRKSLSAAEKKKLFEEREEAYRERLAMGGGSRRTRAVGPTDDEGVPSVATPPAQQTPQPQPGSSRRTRGRRMDIPDATPGTARTDAEATPSRRTRASRQAEAVDGGSIGSPLDHLQEDEEEGLASPGIKPQHKPQRGVLGLKTVAVLTDRERREQERNLDLVADSIDAADEYKRFNVGWILPEGSKRRRVGPPPPPPKKRQSGTSTGSRTKESVDGTSAYTRSPAPSDQTAKANTVSVSGSDTTPALTRKRKAAEETEEAPASPKRTRMTIPEDEDELTPVPDSAPPSAMSLRFSSLRDSLSPPPRESEPTPRKGRSATRAQSNTPTAASSRAAASGGSTTSLRRTPTKNAKDSGKDSTPTKNEKSNGADKTNERDEKENETAKDKGKTKGKGGEKKSNGGSSSDDDAYPSGTQVWAKVPSYPYFPGVVVDYINDWETVPQAVLDMDEAEQARGKAWLVRFHDRQHSYGWVHADKLDMLGVDETIDGMYLSGRERGRSRTFKSSHVKTACRKAYQTAMQTMKEKSG